MDIKWFKIELSRLNIALLQLRLLWNWASDEIYYFRLLLNTNSLVLPTEKPVILAWHNALCATCALTVLLGCSQTFNIFSSKITWPLGVCLLGSLSLVLLKFLLFYSSAALPKNPCLSTRTRCPLLSLWKRRKKAWSLRMSEYSLHAVWFKLEQPQSISKWGQLTSPPGLKWAVE